MKAPAWLEIRDEEALGTLHNKICPEGFDIIFIFHCKDI
jgi:hypothetical protein